ncbi:MAG TPA: hypothetical protein VJ860_10665 [Polyangia bacterium]|jgi:hypothetical protein|nr:hypothetical protein [Polyangia bacterium]
MAETPAAHDNTSRLGRFIQNYHGFLSSFVIGVAGLVATSIWQFRQAQNAERQQASEQAIARTKADNDWRIARAEILGKNLSVLSLQGPQTVDQRFGVLLSLSRGNILDPELAVSYALELGRDNPTYMGVVLAGTAHKNYIQLEQAFALTCMQRFGVARRAEVCKDDKLADRSEAIAQLVADELDASITSGEIGKGPMSLLRDEHEVQAHATKMAWLFETYLQDLYERRQWNEVERFEKFSTGARLVAALVLATARTGELVTSAEEDLLKKFHAERRHWLAGYLFSRTCDSECRAKLMQAMLSSYGEAQGDYNDVFKHLLTASRAEAGVALAQLHARLLWCQVDVDDLAEFRDSVLVPTVTSACADPKFDAGLLEDLAVTAALVPEPSPASTGDSVAASATVAWKQMAAALEKRGERFQKAFVNRLARARRERANPPPMIKKQNFCNAENVDSTSASHLDE